MTIKVLDASVIIAMLDEIESIDLIHRCCQRYKLLTSPTVMAEFNQRPTRGNPDCCASLISVEDPSGFDPLPLAQKLLKRYPMLHLGELTVLLIALHYSNSSKETVVFVTDDGAMRKKAQQVISDSSVSESFTASHNLMFTGTIGLILQMGACGLLTKAEMRAVADDLEYSSFRIDKNVLNRLRS